MPISYRMLPDAGRSAFSKLEQAADQLRQTQSYAHNRATEIRRVFSMNAAMDATERRQLEAELRDHESTVKEASENYRAAAAVHSTVRSWVEKLLANPSSYALEDAGRIKPPVQKGETVKECLQRLRGEIASVKNARQRTALAPLPQRDLKLHAAEHVAQQAARAKPLPMITNGEFSVQWFGGGPSAVPAGAVFAMFCAFDPERAEAFLGECIDAMPVRAGAEPLSAFDRGQKLKQLDTQLDLLERQEEACVLALQAEGYAFVARRPDASPLALLGIQWARPAKLPTLANGKGADHKPGKQKRIRPKSTESERAARH